MIYTNKNEEKIRFFGHKFIENNKNICKIVYNGKEEDIETFMIKKNNEKTNYAYQ